MPFKLNSSNNDPLNIDVPVNMSDSLGVTGNTTIAGSIVVSGDNTVSGNVTFGKLTCGNDQNSINSEEFSNLLERIDNSLAKPINIKFNKLSYTRDDNNKTPDLLSRVDFWTNANMDVTYENGYTEKRNIAFKEIMKSGKVLPKTGSSGETVIIGQIHDGSGKVYIDSSGNSITTSWTDGTTLIKLQSPTVSFGENYNTLFMVNQYEAISSNNPEYFASFSPINVTTLKQNKKSGELTAMSSHVVDTTGVKGLYFTCNASMTPWNTHLSSEEFPASSWGYHCYKNKISFKNELGRTYRNTDNSIMWGGDSYFQKNFLNLNQYMFGKYDSSGDEMVSAYNWGYIPEVTVNPNGTASIVKHYSMGRRSHEIAQVMPDQRTVLFGNDSAHGSLFMYIADVSGNLSAGKLYAAKLTQTSASNGGSFNVNWILLGHATDSEVAGFIDTVMPGDMYNLQARDASGGYSVVTSDGSGGFITTYNPKTDDGYIKSRIFNDFTSAPPGAQMYMKYIGTDLQKFAFLEPNRCAEWFGATCETTKLEGVTLNIKDKIAYYAMSSVNGNTLVDTAGENDDIRASPISMGVVMKALLGGGYNTIQGSSRNTTFVQEAIDSVWVPYQLIGMLELRGSSSDTYMGEYLGDAGSSRKPSNPDNLRFSEKLRTLFIGEDTSRRSNQLLWSFNVDTLVTSNIMSTPAGAESTGLNVYDDINGFSYCTTSFQHIGQGIINGFLTYFGEQNVTNALINRWGENYDDITSIGYIPLPYISGNSQQLSIVAKNLKLTDSSGTEFVLNGDILKKLIALVP